MPPTQTATSCYFTLSPSHHLIARVQSFLGDFRAALQSEKSTYAIYNGKVCVCVCVCACGKYDCEGLTSHVYCRIPLSLEVNTNGQRKVQSVLRSSLKKPSRCRKRYTLNSIYTVTACGQHVLYSLQINEMTKGKGGSGGKVLVRLK